MLERCKTPRHHNITTTSRHRILCDKILMWAKLFLIFSIVLDNVVVDVAAVVGVEVVVGVEIVVVDCDVGLLLIKFVFMMWL